MMTLLVIGSSLKFGLPLFSKCWAFYFLSSLDLGLLRDSTETESGYIDFVEGPCPGNDSRFVCADGLGVSLLQQRLTEYRHNIGVVIT